MGCGRTLASCSSPSGDRSRAGSDGALNDSPVCGPASRPRLGVDPWDPTKYYDFAISVRHQDADALVNDYAVGELRRRAACDGPDRGRGLDLDDPQQNCAALALRGLLRAFVPALPVSTAPSAPALFIGQPSFHAIVLASGAALMSGVAATASRCVLRARCSRHSLRSSSSRSRRSCSSPRSGWPTALCASRSSVATSASRCFSQASS